jgi:hypothetical protein
MFNAEDFCLQYSIDFNPDVHNRWLNIACPFCTDRGYHLGINIDHGYTTCFKCGWHWLPKTISAVLNVGLGEAQRIIREYSSGDTLEEYTTERPDRLRLPPGIIPLSEVHYGYLKSRGFKPSTARTWRLMATGIHGQYSHRIIAPIYLDHELVSYQGRDISGRSSLRYKACAKQDEVCLHQHTLYGIDSVKSSSVIILEGITDVWRIGPGSVSCFGIEWTTQQARMIATRFKRFAILFDSEEQAGEKAYELYQYLTSRGLSGEILTLPSDIEDPAELTDAQVINLRKEIEI